MLELDPSEPNANVPMFRNWDRPDGPAFTTDGIRDLAQSLMVAIGEEPAEFGAHSLRIGGATALFAAGADPIHIKTMGR